MIRVKKKIDMEKGSDQFLFFKVRHSDHGVLTVLILILFFKFILVELKNNNRSIFFVWENKTVLYSPDN